MKTKWVVAGSLVFLVVLGTGISFVWNPAKSDWEGSCICEQTQGGLPRWSGTCNEEFKRLYLRNCP